MFDREIVAALPLLLLIFSVAVIYSSVGHGGASGYLAVLALFSFPAQQMSSTALALNVLVSALAFWSFRQKGYRLPKFSWLLVLASVPFSFLGGTLRIAETFYQLLLGLALMVAAARLAFGIELIDDTSKIRKPTPLVLAGTGSAIGLMSGIVGVGGGIFLSPIALLLRWAETKSVATMSALFILVNSVSGLIGRSVSNRLDIEPAVSLIVAAFLGGLIGSRLSAMYLSGASVRRLISLVLVIAATKLIVMSLSGNSR